MWRQEVALAGNALGGGFDGENLRLKLMEKGLEVDYLQKTGATPVCDVYVTTDGDRTMFGYGFHNEENSTPLDHLPFTPGGWFTSDPNMAHASREAAKLAKEKGMNIYLMDFAREDEVIPEGAICQYGSDNVGDPGNGSANKRWVQDWARKRKCRTILTDGGNGLFYCEPGSPAIFLPPFPPDLIIDSTGAGDAFRAGVIYGLIHGRPIGHAMMFGAASAALKVAHLGATEHIPTVHEVGALIAANPEVAKLYNF